MQGVSVKAVLCENRVQRTQILAGCTTLCTLFFRIGGDKKRPLPFCQKVAASLGYSPEMVYLTSIDFLTPALLSTGNLGSSTDKTPCST